MALLFVGQATGTWQTATWRGTSGGQPAAAGVYFVHLDAGIERRIERVVLVK